MILFRLIKHTEELLEEKEEKLCVKVLRTLREMMSIDPDYGEKVILNFMVSCPYSFMVQLTRCATLVLMEAKMLVNMKVFCSSLCNMKLMRLVPSDEKKVTISVVSCRNCQCMCCHLFVVSVVHVMWCFVFSSFSFQI